MSCATEVRVTPMDVTWSGSSIGITQGDIEFPISEDQVDVTAHQFGTTVLTQIRTGRPLQEITITLLDTSPTRLKQIFGPANYVGQASAATGVATVLGFGTSKDFLNVTAQAAKLVLHPRNKAASDRSEDWAAWKAYPVPTSITFSGESASTAEVTFRLFLDCTKAKEFGMYVYGDHLNGNFAAVKV